MTLPGLNSPAELRKLLAVGSGIGIEIRDKDLEIAVARVRPRGIRVLGRTTIHDFRERPAGEWGAEYSRFLGKLGAGHLSATVLLPRREIIVRQIALAGVAGKDLNAAIELQLDTLHPYGDEEVAYGWSPLGKGAVLIGVTRRATLDRYLDLFAEAGISLAAFTFSAAAIRAAIRLFALPSGDGVLAVSRTEHGAVEIYGESQARPVFSAEFDVAPERAVALAAAELRLAAEVAPLPLESVLPAPQENPIENDLSRNALPYAAALAGACPRLTPAPNLLPPERRSSNSRAMFIPTAVLACLLLLVSGAVLAYSAFEDHRYLQELDREIARLEPQARRAAALDREMDRIRSRSRLLDEFRGRTRSDLDALNELTKLLPPPVWTNSVEMTRDAVTISGEAEQAAGLIKVLDASPYFQNSDFSLIARTGSNELFRIRTQREAHK